MGYERRLALSKDKTNLKWRPLHEGAKFNATGRRNKKLMARNNWYKRKADDSIVTSPKKRRKSEVEQEVGTEVGPMVSNETNVGIVEGQTERGVGTNIGVINVVGTGAEQLVSNGTEVGTVEG